MLIEYEPALVEAAVLAAVGAGGEAFHREREPLYAIADAEAREAAFLAYDARWFRQLGLDQPLSEALAEHPEVVAACGRCVVARARSAHAEAADLLMAPPERPTLLIRCMPERLAAAARAFLRHELLHVADMLDPHFGYEPRLDGDSGGLLGSRLAERYRVLWAAYVDGRLFAGSQAPARLRADHLREFRAAFPELGDQAPAAFDIFFGAQRRTHAELVAFARGGGARPGPEPAGAVH